MRFTYSMSNLIFCPHTDDAIFSLGDYLIGKNNITVAAAFAGIPTDDYGRNKHTVLRKEHDEACSLICAKVINGDLLDDVYGKQDKATLVSWIKKVIDDNDTSQVQSLNIFIPLGIHHPDHIFLSNSLFEIMDMYNCTFFVYAELPYRILYPELFNERLNKFKSKYILDQIDIAFTGNKKDAVEKYQSQIDKPLMEKLIVEENLWMVKS